MLEQPDDALAIIRTGFGDAAYQDASRLSILAHWAAHYGDSELALAAPRRAYVEQRGITVSNIWFPIQRATRRLPGFKDMVRELGLYDYWRQGGRCSQPVRERRIAEASDEERVRPAFR